MKKVFTKLAAFALTLSFVFALSGVIFTQYTQASPENPNEPCRILQGEITNAPCKNVTGGTEKSAVKTSDDSSWWLDSIFKPFFGWITNIVLGFVSLLTGIAGIFLNGVIYHTVVNVAENYENIKSIDVAWKTVRDVANMGFIFILLYAAIMTIIGQGSDNQKLIVKVVVMAILINFSLFFTKVIIDVSNLMALTFYEAIVPGAAAKGFALSETGLSNAFTQYLHLTSFFSSSENGANLTMGGIITMGLMGSILLLIAAFVFFAVAFMFVIRYVVLIIVLILSPIAFMAMILPQLKPHATKWWDALMGQAIFAPIYFMLTWVTLKVLEGIMGPGNAVFGKAAKFSEVGNLKSQAGTDVVGTIANTSTPEGVTATFINFSVVIIFLIVSLIIAKDWASKGGTAISSMNKWAMGVAGGASFGVAGRLGRGTIGLGADKLANVQGFKDAAGKGGVGGFLAKRALLATRGTADSSFDFRAGKAGGATIGNVAGKAGGKGGFADYKKKKAEEEEKFAKSLGPSDEVKDKAKRELELAQEEEKKVKKNAEQQADREFKKPPVLEKLEKDAETAEKMAANSSMSEAARQTAREQAAKLRAQAQPIKANYESRREQRIESLISSSGISPRVKKAQENVDKLAGPSKERKAELTDEVNKQQKQTEANDPSLSRAVEKQKEVLANVEKLTKEIQTAVGSEKEKLSAELEAKNQELKIAKQEVDTRRASVKQEFDERRKSIKDMKGLGDINKAKYAEVVRNSIFAKLGGYNQAAAAKIRGGKSTKDQLAEAAEKLFKENKETEDVEKTEKEKPDENAPAEGGEGSENK